MEVLRKSILSIGCVGITFYRYETLTTLNHKMGGKNVYEPKF
jgi:hypothetical protein